MAPDPHSASLRRILLVDAATCTLAGAVMALGSTLLAPVTGIPAALLLYAGVALFPVAAFMAFVAWNRPLHPKLVWMVVEGNLIWVGGSVLLLLGGWISPNALGIGFILLQALAVAGLAALEYLALRRAAPALEASLQTGGSA